MTQVRIPPVLREAAAGNKQVEIDGATVGEVLTELSSRFPALRDQLFDAEGRLNRFVNVYLNEEDVRYLAELETPAGGRDTIVVLPAMAGGARVHDSPMRQARGTCAGSEARAGSWGWRAVRGGDCVTYSRREW